MKLEEAGVVWTYPNKCAPLEDIRIVFKWNGLHVAIDKVLGGL